MKYRTRSRHLLCIVLMTTCSAVFAGPIDDDIKSLGKEYTAEQMKATNDILAAGPLAIPMLVSNMSNPNPIIRKWCVILLRRMKDRNNFKILEDLALNDTDWLVREAAIETLADYKDPALSVVFGQVALHDSAENNRVAAIRYLSYLTGRDSLPVLRKVFKADSNPVVRLNAGRELAKWGDYSSYQLARGSLSSENSNARYAAVGVLGYNGNTSDTEILEKIAADPKEDGGVRYEAFSASNHINLIHMASSEQLPYLAKCLADASQKRRQWAMKELVAHKGDQTRILMKEILAKPKHPGKQEAMIVLQRIGE